MISDFKQTRVGLEFADGDSGEGGDGASVLRDDAHGRQGRVGLECADGGCRMNEAHEAIGKWMAANGRESAGQSWEIYGDPTPNPADTETTIVYRLK